MKLNLFAIPLTLPASGRGRTVLNVFLALCLINFVASMLMDVEYTGEDITLAGMNIFHLQSFPEPAQSPQSPQIPADLELFPLGLDSLRPENIQQGHIYDCRFLATVGALVNTETGRRALFDNIKKLEDGDYQVKFPGTGETILVPALSTRELQMAARTRDYQAISARGLPPRRSSQSPFSAGIWLAVLEKAYGQYRNAHQDPLSVFKRFCKHSLLERRPTCISALPAYGAAYGATDDIASLLLAGPQKELQEHKTFSFECGEFGLGKGYVTLRQLRSWFERERIYRETVEEQTALLQGVNRGRLAIATTEINGDCQVYGLNSSHAYCVLSYDPSRKLIKLLDPYGQGDIKYAHSREALDGKEDGIFVVGLRDFNLLFSHLRVSAI